MTKRDPALIDVFVAVGSMAELARRLNISRAAVFGWKKVPMKHLNAVSEMTGIPREKLRPDIYDQR